MIDAFVTVWAVSTVVLTALLVLVIVVQRAAGLVRRVSSSAVGLPESASAELSQAA